MFLFDSAILLTNERHHRHRRFFTADERVPKEKDKRISHKSYRMAHNYVGRQMPIFFVADLFQLVIRLN
jgi:hypothetical protein